MDTQVEQLKHENDDASSNTHGHEHHKLVEISFDGVVKQIEKGTYAVSDLKATLGVAADLELDQVKDGEFKALPDDSDIKIKGGEVLVSHVRRGGSS